MILSRRAFFRTTAIVAVAAALPEIVQATVQRVDATPISRWPEIRRSGHAIVGCLVTHSVTGEQLLCSNFGATLNPPHDLWACVLDFQRPIPDGWTTTFTYESRNGNWLCTGATAAAAFMQIYPDGGTTDDLHALGWRWLAPKPGQPRGLHPRRMVNIARA